MKSRLIILVLFLLFTGCATDKSPVESAVHPDGWTQVTNTENFHGTKVQLSGYQSCQSCHGVDLKGGESGVSCYQANCHADYPLILNDIQGTDKL